MSEKIYPLGISKNKHEWRYKMVNGPNGFWCEIFCEKCRMKIGEAKQLDSMGELPNCADHIVDSILKA